MFCLHHYLLKMSWWRKITQDYQDAERQALLQAGGGVLSDIKFQEVSLIIHCKSLSQCAPDFWCNDSRSIHRWRAGVPTQLRAQSSRHSTLIVLITKMGIGLSQPLPGTLIFPRDQELSIHNPARTAGGPSSHFTWKIVTYRGQVLLAFFCPAGFWKLFLQELPKTKPTE